MRIWCAIALSLIGSQGQAACSDIFHGGRPTVQLCVGQECEIAVMSRSCGNVEAVAENYEADSVLWIFRRRFHNRDDDADDEYAVLHDPLDPDDIPLRMVNGRPTRIVYDGAPVGANTLQQMTCIPQNSSDGCDFTNTVLENLHTP